MLLRKKRKLQTALFLTPENSFSTSLSLFLSLPAFFLWITAITLVRAANLLTAHEERVCMPSVRQHTPELMVIYAISRTMDNIQCKVKTPNLVKFCGEGALLVSQIFDWLGLKFFWMFHSNQKQKQKQKQTGLSGHWYMFCRLLKYLRKGTKLDCVQVTHLGLTNWMNTLSTLEYINLMRASNALQDASFYSLSISSVLLTPIWVALRQGS